MKSTVIKSILIGMFFISFQSFASKPAMHPSMSIKDTPECEQCLKDYAKCSMRAIDYAPLDAIREEIQVCATAKETCLLDNQCRNKE